MKELPQIILETVASLNKMKDVYKRQHWIIADKDSCIVVESMKDGLHVYDNPVGVLTNNPPFPSQMFALNLSLIHIYSLIIVKQILVWRNMIVLDQK